MSPQTLVEDALATPETTAIVETKKPKRLFWKLIAGAVVVLVLGEASLRLYGLGNPAILRFDPDLEYIFVPNQDCSRYGNRIHINAYSMRCDDFPPKKTDPKELRVLVVGDSLPNGGNQIDQSKIFPSLLREGLLKETGRPVVVGNASAGSWGPPNMLAYVRKYGFFDSDVMVLFLSSHEYADAPTFIPVIDVNPDYPGTKPVLALQEIFTWAIPKVTERLRGDGHKLRKEAPADSPDIPICTKAVHDLITLAQSNGVHVIVALYPDYVEMKGKYKVGHDILEKEIRASGINPIDIREHFKTSPGKGMDLYDGLIHPNAQGHRVIAEALVPSVISATQPRSQHPVGE